MVKWLLVLWGFSGFSGFLMVLMVWNVIPRRQSIRGVQTMISHQAHQCVSAGERERETEKLCVSICTVNVCVCNDVDGQNIVQTDNESRPLQSHYRNTKPNLCFLWVTFSVSTSCSHVCTLKWSSFTCGLTSLHTYISFRLPYTHKKTHPCPYPPIYSLRDTQLFADASQWPQYHCCDDLLNGKWYHTRPHA